MMITIKEISRLAGVSPSTVSIVLSGKSEERKISEATRQKVMKIAAENGYRANVQAVNLRTSSSPTRFRINILWTADYRARIMMRLIQSIQSEILNHPYPCEVILIPYIAGKINETLTDDLIRSCHGLLICNTSEEDMEFLESHRFQRPIVLYNRYSKIYPTVTMDDKEIGQMSARILSLCHCCFPAVVNSPATFTGINIRTNVFIRQCEPGGMRVPPVYTTSPDQEGGYAATAKLFDEHPETDGVFYLSDTMAIGALRYFHMHHIDVPEQVKIIAVGNNLAQWCDYSWPSVSTIDLPIEKVAVECFKLLYQLMNYQKPLETSVIVPVNYIERESCAAAEKREQ